jgi:hypothetical protein
LVEIAVALERGLFLGKRSWIGPLLEWGAESFRTLSEATLAFELECSQSKSLNPLVTGSLLSVCALCTGAWCCCV